MIASIQDLVIAGVGALASFVLISYVIDYLKVRRYAKIYGTQEPTILPCRLPFGIDRYILLTDSVNRDEVPTLIQSLHKRLNAQTFQTSMLGMTTIQTQEPRNIQAILATQFKEFALGEARYRSFAPLLGKGIFTTDGKFWEMSRAMMRPQFSREQVSHLQSLEEHVDILCKCIPQDGSAVDLQDLFFRLTLDSATEFLLGESVHTLSKGVDGFGSAFNLGQEHLMNRIRMRSLYWLHNPQEFKDVNIICKQFIDKFVNKALYDRNNKVATDEKSTKYVFLEALTEETQDPILLRDQCMNILLAGRDTTGGLLSFIFLLLGRHPEVEKKLREVVRADFGDDDKVPLTFESLKSCTYLKWVINETLRLFPAVPFNSRVALKDTTIPLGGGPDGKAPLFIRRGTPVEYSAFCMHRREDIWGPDANLFRPERWSEPRKLGYGGFEYLPFNGGPRICIGQQYALTEASFTVVRLLQRFKRMECLNYDVEYKMRCTLTMCVGGNGVIMKMHRK